MSYNALDNHNKALELRDLLLLEVQDVIASIEYQEATSANTYSLDENADDWEFVQIVHRAVYAINRYLEPHEPTN